MPATLIQGEQTGIRLEEILREEVRENLAANRTRWQRLFDFLNSRRAAWSCRKNGEGCVWFASGIGQSHLLDGVPVPSRPCQSPPQLPRLLPSLL